MNKLIQSVFSAAFLIIFFYIPISYAEVMSVGQVVWVKGNLKAVMGDKKERVLKRGAAFYEHDIIVSDKNSTGQLVFTDGQLMTVNTDTTVRIDDFKYSKTAKPKEDKAVMTLIKGGFRAITGTIPKNNPEGWSVNTPVATIGVRGTSLAANYSVKKKELAAASNDHPVKVSSTGCKNGKGSSDCREATISPSTKGYVTINSEGQVTISSTPPAALGDANSLPVDNALAPNAKPAPKSLEKSLASGSQSFGGTSGGGSTTGPRTVNSFCIGG